MGKKAGSGIYKYTTYIHCLPTQTAIFTRVWLPGEKSLEYDLHPFLECVNISKQHQDYRWKSPQLDGLRKVL